MGFWGPEEPRGRAKGVTGSAVTPMALIVGDLVSSSTQRIHLCACGPREALALSKFWHQSTQCA